MQFEITDSKDNTAIWKATDYTLRLDIESGIDDQVYYLALYDSSGRLGSILENFVVGTKMYSRDSTLLFIIASDIIKKLEPIDENLEPRELANVLKSILRKYGWIRSKGRYDIFWVEQAMRERKDKEKEKECNPPKHRRRRKKRVVS